MGRKVVLAGCGNMGYAMLDGWLSSGRLAGGDVQVVEPDAGLRARAADRGAGVAADAQALAEPDLVVFAVKPQVMGDVVPAYRRLAPRAAFLSVAAGIGVAALEEMLGHDAQVLRCMPNTPAAIGKGMLVVFANARVEDGMKAFVDGLLSANGEVAHVSDEALMDAVTAVSGSGPAYVFHFIECLAAAGVGAGLPEETAARLALQTVYGAACLAKESGEAPGRLRERVTSPNGTTAAALDVLMSEERLARLLREAVEAARRRGVELGS